jgi:hypothetical protein
MSANAPIPYQGPYTEDDLELFGEFRFLYPIVVEGRRFAVPAENCVLRACQYIEMKERALRMPWRDYCWNDTDGCCEMTYRERPDGPALFGRACRVPVKPGMEIIRLPKGGRACAPRR